MLKTHDTIRAHMRLMEEATEAPVDATKSLSWGSAEFWSMAGGAVANLVTVAALLGWVDHSDAETLTKAMTALIAATQVIVLNSVLVWKFISGRTQLKLRVMDMQARRMEILAQTRAQFLLDQPANTSVEFKTYGTPRTE
jgi:anti-sigma-K factor RskA